MKMLRLESFLLEQKTNYDKDCPIGPKETIIIGNQVDNSNNLKEMKAFIKFLFDFFDNKSVKIKTAYLNLYIKNWKSFIKRDYYDFLIRINSEGYNNIYTGFSVTEEELNNGKISVDISDLVIKWINKDIENLGIIIESIDCDFTVSLIANCTKYRPTLNICYEFIEEDNCCSNRVEALELQVNGKRRKNIKDNENIIFDFTRIKEGKSLRYNAKTGEITINKKGVYAINWVVSLDGSGDANEISLMIESEGERLNTGSCAYVFAQYQLSGNSLIVINDIPKTISLVNKSGAIIQYADVTIQSTLTIFKI